MKKFLSKPVIKVVVCLVTAGYLGKKIIVKVRRPFEKKAKYAELKK